MHNWKTPKGYVVIRFGSDDTYQLKKYDGSKITSRITEKEMKKIVQRLRSDRALQSQD